MVIEMVTVTMNIPERSPASRSRLSGDVFKVGGWSAKFGIAVGTPMFRRLSNSMLFHPTIVIFIDVCFKPDLLEVTFRSKVWSETN